MFKENGANKKTGRCDLSLKREQVKTVVEIHDYIQKSYSLFMLNFTIAESDRLNKKANADLETILLESKNVFELLLKSLGEIPLELSNELDKAYEENDEAIIKEVEKKIENWE